MTNSGNEDTNKRSSEFENPAPNNPDNPVRQNGPEPPVRYNPSQQLPPMKPPSGGDDSQAYFSTRRMVTAAQIMAVVSLLIGGVFLGSAALIVAVLAYRKAVSGLQSHLNSKTQQEIAWILLKRSATIAIVMGALCLAANVVALIVIYPSLMEMLQTGDYSSYFGSAPSGQETTGSGHSIWG